MILAPLVAGGYHHLANERADVLAGLPIGLRLGERFGEADHLGAVVLSDIRIDVPADRPGPRQDVSRSRPFAAPSSLILASWPIDIYADHLPGSLRRSKTLLMLRGDAEDIMAGRMIGAMLQKIGRAGRAHSLR